MFDKNVGQIDRAIRVILGLLGILAFFLGWVTGTWGWVALIVGVVLLVTGAMGSCALYSVLGISTDRTG